MRGCDVEGELLNQPGQAWRLSLRDLQHQARQGRGVDDRVLERALEAATDEPRVECVVAVLDEHRPVSEAQEGTPGVAKLGRADEHRAIDVVAPVRVRIDGRLAVDEGVEEGKRGVEPETLGADLEHEEGCVAGGLDVEGDELRLVQPGLGTQLGRVDRDRFPRHWLHGPSGFEEERFLAHRVSASARRAQAISSRVTPRRSRTAPA
jgi:hypothetical protein